MTFSMCMIVKNEEEVLERCLTSFAPLFDEIIVVDTGSSDATKEIAARYTDRIYDFAWVDDFAAARNFAFSKATMDYIYSCDADEVLDAENYAAFAALKEALLPEIEIVQMHYKETSTTVLNAKSEYRAKLFKRLRTFIWQDPVHESIRTEPVVFDSDITILHCPSGAHHRRDFAIFLKAFEKGSRFTKNLYHTYVSELYKCGSEEDFARAIPVFTDRMEMELSADAYSESACVLAHAYRVKGETAAFFDYALKITAGGGCSEMCCELGEYYLSTGQYADAVFWLSHAVYGTQPVVDIHASGDKAFSLLSEAYAGLGDDNMAAAYRDEAERWELPEEL
ncbi:MAG: glycosyltransferase family 2 protein [Lachnospiraceae bacterium]|nr:glycosyltransferase family 2 protein [Lachnospiraceae bacterium]